ncbi:MAG: AAA family ATPase [Rhodocyclaceae bacterium]|nr:AAA family ATPase [Rhodocyclaceae bacterium]MDZ4215081.1 AAA family ATPase [Rhodocyclaceae bacterium]
MYLQHFGVREFPFSITPDTSYFFSSEGAQDALSTLLVAARTGEGFIKVTGEVGTGKTLLCRKLMASLEKDFKIGYIPNPYLEPRTLFLELASELGAELPPDAQLDQHQLLKALTERLLEIIREGKRVVLCLDEVQAMPIETLEALRLLTNLETEKRKLLQVIIFGQPELEEKLNHPSIRQLKQRITFDFHLTSLSRDELDFYVHHRLMVAGFQGGRLFTPMAMWMLQRRTKRVPRLVNIIAHKAMLAAYGQGKKKVSFFDVLAAANDTASTRQPRWIKNVKLALMILIGGGLAGMGWVWLQ